MVQHRVLIIDHKDSFTHILAQYFAKITGEMPTIFDHDKTCIKEIQAFNPTHIILSPGPGSVENKADFQIGGDILDNFEGKVPILGVCLGHQGIGYHYGSKISPALDIMHGKKSSITHDGTGLFENIKNPLTVMRYHSLALTGLAPCLKVTAKAPDGTIMAIEHKNYPTYGVQFHPESLGTDEGEMILRNLLNK